MILERKKKRRKTKQKKNNGWKGANLSFFFLMMWQFAQELLSTFSNSIGEVALVPSTGGVFVIDITHVVVVVPTDTDIDTDTTSTQSGGGGRVLSNIPSTKQTTTRLWDRKVDGGFPGM